jgi:hypothetical protein
MGFLNTLSEWFHVSQPKLSTYQRNTSTKSFRGSRPSRKEDDLPAYSPPLAYSTTLVIETLHLRAGVSYPLSHGSIDLTSLNQIPPLPEGPPVKTTWTKWLPNPCRGKHFDVVHGQCTLLSGQAD